MVFKRTLDPFEKTLTFSLFFFVVFARRDAEICRDFCNGCVKKKEQKNQRRRYIRAQVFFFFFFFKSV